MQKIWVLLIFMGGFLSLSAQSSATKYWIYFADKGQSAANAKNYAALLPAAMLEARLKKNIPITQEDLPVSQLYKQQLIDLGFQPAAESRWLNAVAVEISDAQQLSTIQSLPFVQRVESVKFGVPLAKDISGQQIIANENKSSKSSSTIDYGLATRQNTMIGIEYLHDLGFTGTGVKIAVLDAGFKGLDSCGVFDHMLQNNHVLARYNVLDSTNNIYTLSEHGTEVLSTIAAYEPGTFVGTAFDADFVFVIAEPYSAPYDETDWIQAAEWADAQGADIIQSSLGYFYDPSLGSLLAGMEGFTYEVMDGSSTAITRAADKAAGRGIIVVNASGNNGQYPNYKKINAPCDGDSVLCVGGVDSSGTHSASAGQGPTFDGSIKPDIVAQSKLVVCSKEGACTQRQNGTSLSTPLISGLAACLLQAHPTRSGWDIVQAIKQSGSKYPNPDTLDGNGIPNARIADSLLTIQDSLDTISSIGQLEKDNLAIFPQPAGNLLTVTGVAPNTSIHIINLLGAQVMELIVEEEKSITIDISRLNSGIYFLKADQKGINTIQRFIKL
ncbi:MAG: S8/S53 family peptidase [Chitinophagales bacterium]|nr:S8/S53 family peptidase [Chitinophagales bacterium]